MASGFTTLRDSILPAIDAIRGIPYVLGMRLYTVTVTQRIWSGSRVGLGQSVTTNLPLKVAAGSALVTVRQITQKEIIASAGQFSQQTLVIGPITPPFKGNLLDNDQITVFDPLQGNNTEIWFNVVGPGHPSPGTWMKKVQQDVSKPFRYMIYIDNTGETPG